MNLKGFLRSLIHFVLLTSLFMVLVEIVKLFLTTTDTLISIGGYEFSGIFLVAITIAGLSVIFEKRQ